MRTVIDLAELERHRPTILTIGAFDGVHRGHQYLIGQVVERARQTNHDAAVITFDPRPLVVLRPGSLQLTDADEKARIIGSMGPTTLVTLPFTRELADVPAGQFLAHVLEHINVSEVWIGADFAFGHNREGNIQFLIQAGQRDGFAVHVVSRQRFHGLPASSTAVREEVAVGNVEQATRILGHYLRLTGRVVSGFGRGMDLGYPTANIETGAAQLLPATGIYAGYLSVHGTRRPAAISVGTNPTFGGSDVVVEAYVLDFSDNVRDQVVSLDFVARIRPERAFETVDALVVQMGHDVERVREILAHTEEPGDLLL